MLVTPSTNEAEIGVTGSVHVDWGGLFSGPAAKFVGDVSHSDATGIQDVTTIHVENDAGFGFCDLIACP